MEREPPGLFGELKIIKFLYVIELKKINMKKAIFILTILLAATVVSQAQTNICKKGDKNTGLFGLIQGSYIKNFHAYEETNIKNVDVNTQLNTKQSNAYSLNFIVVYYVIPKRLTAGLGFGLDGYNNPNANTAPLYGDVRFYFTSERNIPFVYVEYGGMLQLGKEFHKGQVARIGAGYRFFATKKLRMTADISFVAKSLSYTNEPVLRSKDALFIKGVGFTLGFQLF